MIKYYILLKQLLKITEKTKSKFITNGLFGYISLESVNIKRISILALKNGLIFLIFVF